MQVVVSFLPGVVGATAAFAVTKLLGWTDIGIEASVFLATYIVVTVGVARGMKRYGTPSGD
jgi:hypothetical protein